MSSSTLAAGLLHLRSQLAAQQRGGDSDEQLLHDFTTRRDESAFAVLLRRHGPMVLHVCRRVLGHEQDAEDAFQATFLVLAQNAASLRNKTALASWLHGTAYRTALKARQSAARRRKHEEQTAARSPANPSEELLWREVRTLLDEEIMHLPEIYRSVFVLCCLESLSQMEASRRLGMKVRTVSNRLAEARKRLGQQLRRRGVELTAVLAISGLAAQSASALPTGLMATTIQSTLAAAAGEGLSGIVSASVAQLVKSATAAMMVSKAKIATVLLLTASMLAGASVWAYRGLAANALTPSTQPAEPPAGKADDKKAALPQREAAKTVEIQGCVLDPDGKPKAGAELLLLSHGSNGKVTQLGVSAADGCFTALIPQVKKELSPALIAQADGAGMGFIDLRKWKAGKSVELRLVKDREIRGRIVNTEGKPVVGARLTVENVGIGDNESMDSFLTQWKKKFYGAALPPGGIQLMSPLDSGHQKGALFAATTDTEGRFAFRGLGEERFVWLHLSGGGVAVKNLWIVNRGGFDPKPYNQAARDRVPKGMELRSSSEMLRGPDLSVIAEAEKVIRGTVKDADSGKGRPNVVVHLSHAGGRGVEVPLQSTTDAEGRYEIRGAHKAQSYTLQVAEDATLGYMPSRLEAADTPGYQPVLTDIRVKKGVIITGRIIERTTGKPVRGFVESAVLVGNPFAKDYPPFDLMSGWFRLRDTDADGDFRVVAIPGPVLLMGGPSDPKTECAFKSPLPDAKYPHYFDNSLGPDFPCLIDFHGVSRPIQGNFCKVLQIKEDAKVVKQDIVLERASVLSVQIHDADDKPLLGVWVGGSRLPNMLPPIQCDQAECSAYQVEAGKPRLLVFFHPVRKLVGTLTVKGGEKAPVVAKLGPAGSIKGRLLGADGKALAGVEVDVQYSQNAASAVHNVIHRAKQIVTDSNGAFAFDELIPELKFKLTFRHGRRRFERQAKPADTRSQVKAGECRDLGAIKLKPLAE